MGRERGELKGPLWDKDQLSDIYLLDLPSSRVMDE